MRLHNVKLRRYKSPSGMTVSGLWESDIVRMEAVDGCWQCHVPMREIGSEIGRHTGVYEFRPIDRGGRWVRIGTYRNRDGCCIVAERLKSGEYVWRSGYSTEDGPVHSVLVKWVEVAEHVAKYTAI